MGLASVRKIGVYSSLTCCLGDFPTKYHRAIQKTIAQTSTGIVVLLVAAGIEVVYEELAHLLQVPTKKCGVVYSHTLVTFYYHFVGL